MDETKTAEWHVISGGKNWPYLLREPGEAMGIYTTADYLNALEQRVADAERERDEAYRDTDFWTQQAANIAKELNAERAKAQRYREALEALAKVQYDGTVEGLREQIRTEDWGDVLDIDRTKAAYELTLAALADAAETGA